MAYYNTGILNFIERGVIVGKPYTRKFYHKVKGLKKQHHHVTVDREIRADCRMWLEFLSDLSSVSRPFVDFDKETYHAEQLQFFTDTSRAPYLRFGAIFDSHWTYLQWEENYIVECNPSIEYLELYALTVAIQL